jgi:ApbE superfamily uncharacterized protein (UPF0280 family)
MSGWAATRRQLDPGRWHFAQGPIDLVIGAEGDAGPCALAFEEAWACFGPVLQTLVQELPILRAPSPAPRPPAGPVAARMHEACSRMACVTGVFITPMAAVAGSVADHLIDCFVRPGVRRAYVNNGGDIALHLEADARYRVGLVADLDAPAIDAEFDVLGNEMARGVASSGWRGRSLSMGIADTVTVIATDAALADAAATLIANAVDVDDPAIERAPASAVRDDSDLGERLVTIAVGPLGVEQVDSALDAGEQFALQLAGHGLIERAALVLAGRWRLVDRRSRRSLNEEHAR